MLIKKKKKHLRRYSSSSVGISNPQFIHTSTQLLKSLFVQPVIEIERWRLRQCLANWLCVQRQTPLKRVIVH